MSGGTECEAHYASLTDMTPTKCKCGSAAARRGDEIACDRTGQVIWQRYTEVI